MQRSPGRQAPDQARHRCHFVKTKVRAHRYSNDTLAVFHGPRRLADYTATGQLITKELKQAVWTLRQVRRYAPKPVPGYAPKEFPLGDAPHHFPSTAQKHTIHVLRNRTILKTPDRKHL